MNYEALKQYKYKKESEEKNKQINKYKNNAMNI